MPEPMLLHPLTPDVKCPACGADLTFIRVRGWGDLYQCSGGRCKCRVMHCRNQATKTCGWALLNSQQSLGMWFACGETAAKGE